MSGGALAGRLRNRVTIERRAAARDAIGGASGGWETIATVWAAVAPDGAGDDVEADAPAAMPRWRVTVRAGHDVEPGDRLLWGARRLQVRGRVDDPAILDRIILICREKRT